MQGQDFFDRFATDSPRMRRVSQASRAGLGGLPLRAGKHIFSRHRRGGALVRMTIALWRGVEGLGFDVPAGDADDGVGGGIGRKRGGEGAGFVGHQLDVVVRPEDRGDEVA
jgi:hypothetical protein